MCSSFAAARPRFRSIPPSLRSTLRSSGSSIIGIWQGQISIFQSVADLEMPGGQRLEAGNWTLATKNIQICRVVGTVVSTQKNRKLEGAKLLLVQPLTLEDTARGVALIAIDSVGAGVGERVLVVIEGKAAGDALGRKAAAVDAAVIGIVDVVDYKDDV
jgi:ethanolamine utilization protein EutN